jgi:hypothetical protein
MPARLDFTDPPGRTSPFYDVSSMASIFAVLTQDRAKKQLLRLVDELAGLN